MKRLANIQNRFWILLKRTIYKQKLIIKNNGKVNKRHHRINGRENVLIKCSKKCRWFAQECNPLTEQEVLSETGRFEQLNHHFVSLQKKYNGKFHELNATAEKNAHRFEYAKGGELMHRGFYSPSSEDVFVGNVSRGRLLKSVPKKGYGYEYAFDSCGKLIACKKFSNVSALSQDIDNIEFLIYENEGVLSLIYNTIDKRIDVISECYYVDGRLQKYQLAIMLDDTCAEIKEEESIYTNDLISEIYLKRYMPMSGDFYEEKYSFSYNDQKEISSYTVMVKQ